MPFPTRSGSRAGTAGRECPAKNAETMISAVYYIFLVLLCTFFMILSALALVVCYPFDKGRRVVHELSRILVRTFFAIPPRWRQRVEGLEHVDRKKSYVSSQADDGIYVLIKEVVDNSVDEFIMGAGKQIDVTVEDDIVTVRDYGRGIPLKSLAAAVSEMNTGGKYGGSAFKKTVGLNGVGVKAVNMLSGEFTARSVRDGEARTVTFAQGLEQSDRWESGVQEKNGTFISFRVDREVFGDYSYNLEYVEQMVRNYTYLNLGLTFRFNGQSYVSKNGLLDLLNENMTEEPLYAPIHLSGDDIEVAIAHGTGYGESYFSFVNGQYTSQGGTHQAAFREAIAKTVKEFYHKDYDPSDIRTSIIAAISVKCHRPGVRIADQDQARIEGDRAGRVAAQFRHRFPGQAPRRLPAQALRDDAGAPAEDRRERKGAQAISGIQKKARETAKKVSLNNKKLRDCKIHRTDKHELAEESMIFITEGNSASGSITKSRDVRTQAVFFAARQAAQLLRPHEEGRL